jgi:mRNA interferase RelE/StbE
LSSPGGGWVFTGRARRDLQRLDPPIQRRIVDALDRLTGEPPAGDVVKLTGVEGEWRLRVGDWRVRFQRDSSGVIHVLRVLPRGRAYRD